jgi:hypothetical protein
MPFPDMMIVIHFSGLVINAKQQQIIITITKAVMSVPTSLTLTPVIFNQTQRWLITPRSFSQLTKDTREMFVAGFCKIVGYLEQFGLTATHHLPRASCEARL